MLHIDIEGPLESHDLAGLTGKGTALKRPVSAAGRSGGGIISQAYALTEASRMYQSSLTERVNVSQWCKRPRQSAGTAVEHIQYGS